MWNRGGNELPQSKPDGFASSLGEGASGAPGSFALQPETLPLCQRPHPRGGCLRSRLGEFRQIPPQALPRQLSRREGQAVNLDAKVLGTKRKFPVVLLAPPLGELSPQVTERAHAVNSVAKVSIAMRNLPAMPKVPSPRGLASRSDDWGSFLPRKAFFPLSHPQKLKIQLKNAPDGSKNNLDVLY